MNYCLTSLLLVPILFSFISLLFNSAIVLGLINIVANLILATILSPLLIGIGAKISPSQIFMFDHLSFYGLITVISVSLLVSFYSLAYFKQQQESKDFNINSVKRFYFLSGFLLSAMIFICISSDIGWSWITIEITTLIIAVLLGIFRKSAALESAWKYLITCSVGLILALMGIMILLLASANQSGEEMSLLFSSFTARGMMFNPMLVKIAFIFILVGLGTKIAIAPMHAWLPDAIQKSEIPLAVLLTCALKQVVFIILARLKFIVDFALGNNNFTGSLLIFFGMLSVILVAIFMVNQYDLRRMLANSSIESMGIATIALGLPMREALIAGLIFIFFQSLSKAALFFLVGNIFLVYGTTEIDKIGHVAKRLPGTALFLMITMLSLSGFPPFAVFMSKLILARELIQFSPIITISFLLATVIIFTSFVYVFSKILFFNPAQQIEYTSINYRSPLMLYTKIPVILPLGLVLLSGLFFHESLFAFLHEVVALGFQ